MANENSDSGADLLQNRYSTAVSIAALLLVASCGGQTPPAESAAQTSEPTEAVNPSSDEAAPDETMATDAEEGATESDLAAADAATPEEDPNATRDVVYKMVQGGLEVEVDGVLFRPKAQPVKVKGGAWGVKITMTAEGVGDSTRYLLKPKNGVLAFAGSIKRKGGKQDTFNDHRDGNETVELTPGASVSFESTWPKSGTALWWGDDLTLEAGLWGLGKTADGLRPVKQFFTLRMVAGNKPQPILQPPKSAE